jgi:uncharacterized protein
MNPNLTIPQEKIIELCKAYGVRELSVFGSALRDDFGPQSDVDLLVEFDPDAHIGLIDFIRLQNKFADAFSRPVDLVTKDGLKSRIKQSILDSALIIYAI